MPKAKQPAKPTEWLSPIRCSPALLAAIDQYAAEHKITVSALIRGAICEKIGRKDLDATPKPGWPSGRSRKIS